MKILFLTPSVRLLGARQSLLALATHLPPEVESLVVCPGDGGLTEELQRSGVPVEVVPHGAWRKLGGRLTAQFRQLPALERLSRRFRPTVIHCNEYHITPQGVWTAGKSGGKVGVTSHIRLGIPREHVRKYRLEGCSRIAAVSQACKGLLDGTGLESRTEVIHNGVDVGELWGKAPDRSLRGELGWGADELVLGLFGLVSPRKNQLVAVEAVAQALARGVPARLLLAGDPFKSTEEYGEALRRRIAEPDLAGRVRWLPFQREVGRLYGAIDVNLLISAEEGFGRTIIEAGAVGAPSIGSRIGGIPELIREGETGWLVGEGDAAGLADCLVRLWAERGRLPAVGAATREHVMANFTIQAHVRAMTAFWERAAEGT